MNTGKIEDLKAAAMTMIAFCIGFILAVCVYMQDVVELQKENDKLNAEYKILLENYNENEYMYRKMEEMTNGNTEK